MIRPNVLITLEVVSPGTVEVDSQGICKCDSWVVASPVSEEVPTGEEVATVIYLYLADRMLKAAEAVIAETAKGFESEVRCAGPTERREPPPPPMSDIEASKQVADMLAKFRAG